MVNLPTSVQQKEQLIIGTILSCNDEIKKLEKLTNLQESKCNLYHFNMRQLLNDVNSELTPLFESSKNVPDEFNYVKNSRGNFYAYFQKVDNFLDGYEPNIQKVLNESLMVDEVKVDNPIQVNISTFKKELKSLISELTKKNDIQNLSPEVLKIKTLVKKPIFIYGFDICNNLLIQKELFDKFNFSMANAIAVIYDKSNKQLLFIPNTNTFEIICYDISLDLLDYYNVINSDAQINNFKLDVATYMTTLKENIHNNLLSIYINIELRALKFTDNLYQDQSRVKYVEENSVKQSISSGLIKK